MLVELWMDVIGAEVAVVMGAAEVELEDGVVAIEVAEAEEVEAEELSVTVPVEAVVVM